MEAQECYCFYVALYSTLRSTNEGIHLLIFLAQNVTHILLIQKHGSDSINCHLILCLSTTEIENLSQTILWICKFVTGLVKGPFTRSGTVPLSVSVTVKV